MRKRHMLLMFVILCTQLLPLGVLDAGQTNERALRSGLEARLWSGNFFIHGVIQSQHFSVKSLLPFAITGKGTTEIKANNVFSIGENSPRNYALYQAYPNPFNPKTTIQFELPVESYVTLTVYNTIGQEVARLFDREYMNEGIHSADFDASRLSSGVYYYRITVAKLGNSVDGIESKTYSEIKKMLYMK